MLEGPRFVTPRKRTPLTPPAAAGLLQKVCDAIPAWEYGALGGDRAFDLCEAALRHPDPEVAREGARLALFAWQDAPLHVRLARAAGGVPARISSGAHPARMAGWCRVPPDYERAAEWDDLTPDALCVRLAPLLADPAHGGFWLAQGMERCLRLPQGEEACRRLLGLLPEGLEGLRARLWAQWLLLHGTPEETLQALKRPMPGFESWRDMRAAHCLERLGEARQAEALLRKAWAACPCHPNLILALHHLAFPLPESAPGPPPPMAFYTWNKAPMLGAALESLLRTEAAHAPLFVLDNGSADGTADMLRAFRDHWGESLRIITLPVNIGAPAARNWLLALPEIRERGEVIFLDDDLTLEPGWLDALRRTGAAWPQAAVLGCRVVDSAPPHAVQCGEFFLLPGGERSFLDLEEHFFIHSGSMHRLEPQLTVYARPCLSVSGCCHWLRLGREEPRNFDVRFSPSQFDDLERDMRCVLAGQEVVYAGQARVFHAQHSSLRQAHDRRRAAHIFGNRIKLEFLYTKAQVRNARETAREQARRDLLRKISRLAALESA